MLGMLHGKVIKVTTSNFVFIECLMTVLSVKIIELCDR